jgi:hypothetical protein
VVEGELAGREVAVAILADEAVAQKHVEAREGRPPGRRHIFLERDDAWEPHLEGRAVDRAVVLGDDADAVEEDRLHRILPGPDGQGKIRQGPKIGIEHQRVAGLKAGRHG